MNSEEESRFRVQDRWRWPFHVNYNDDDTKVHEMWCRKTFPLTLNLHPGAH